MTTLQSIKAAKEQKVDDLIKECSMFFAFSNEQFYKNKTPLAEGEKYVDLGAGCYLPKSKRQCWIDGVAAIDAWFKEATKPATMRREYIVYELANHEAYYTGDIEDTVDALGEGYTVDEVRAVFNSQRALHYND